MRSWSYAAVCAALFATSLAHATVYSVGPDADCTFDNLADAVATAASTASGNTHLIKVRNLPYAIPEIVIDNPEASITIQGSFVTCSASAPIDGAQTTLTPLVADNQRLFSLTNDEANPRRSITLKGLYLKDGDAGTLGGGALYVSGKLNVMLSTSVLTENQGPSGGAIYLINFLSGEANRTNLTVLEDTEITNNDATHPGSGQGGGISALGNVRTQLWDATITGNNAGANGGGIAVVGGSTLLGGGGELVIDPLAGESVEISNNSAGGTTFSTTKGYGGGIYVNTADIDGTNHATAPPTFFTILANNRANYGGAAYIEGLPADGSTFVSARFENALVSGNSAKGQGGAFYVKDAVDFNLDSKASAPCKLFLVFALIDTPCSTVLLNKAENLGFVGGNGAGAIFVTSTEPTSERSIARVDRTAFLGNEDTQGNAAVAFASGDNALQFRRSIFSSNIAGGSGSVLLHSSAYTRLWYSTVLANDVTRMFWYDGSDFNARGSILWDPGKPVWYATGSGSVLNHDGCLIVHDSTGLPSGASTTNPHIGAGYRPSSHSDALDRCDNTPEAPIADAYRLTPMDTTGITNAPGYNDIGAVEADIIMISGMEEWLVEP